MREVLWYLISDGGSSYLRDRRLLKAEVSFTNIVEDVLPHRQRSNKKINFVCSGPKEATVQEQGRSRYKAY